MGTRRIDELTYLKVEVLTVLEANRDAHRAIFEEAMEGYREQSIEVLERHLQEAREGKVKTIFVSLPMPEDHTKDYDRIITMLTMTPEDTVVLNEMEVTQYIMDDWRWKRQFLASNSAYSETATRSLESYS